MPLPFLGEPGLSQAAACLRQRAGLSTALPRSPVSQAAPCFFVHPSVHLFIPER